MAPHLSFDDRLKIYNHALHYYELMTEWPDKRYRGLCVQLHMSSLKFGYDFIPYINTLDYFPEILSQKPSSIGWFYWFTKDHEGVYYRIKVLEQAIIKLKTHFLPCAL